ncbi:DUF2934 domain-containing protein [Roseomonas populi]|uniref:DUF2934 domain-containing protein n=1 Tax=Roseomonas populi TaxID=3121582 RepID=A0ABT1X7A6_9PROT|nr:DUF2934 domain-containing protein [Roseomonas pecuniae]MCR0983283.1 DUF2934 domain-containing protein [Roseomonas pecuniae]
MTDDKRIHERAYAIWESAGRPEGQHDAHWEQAAREVAAEANGAAGATDEAASSPKPERAKKRAGDKAPTPAAPDGGSTPAEAAAATKPAKPDAKEKAKRPKAATATDSATLAAPDGGSTPAEAAAAPKAAKAAIKGKKKS